MADLMAFLKVGKMVEILVAMKAFLKGVQLVQL